MLSQRRTRRLPLLLAALLFLPMSGSVPAQTAGGMYVEVFVRGTNGRDTKVGGSLVSRDDSQVVIRTPAGGEQSVAWDDMTPNSAFTLKSRLIDRNSADAWIAIGEWAQAHQYDVQARQAFTQAARLDPKAMSRVKVVAATPATKPAPPPAAIATTADPVAAPGQTQLPQRRPIGSRQIVKYGPVTQAQSDAAIAASRKAKTEAESILKLKLVELETDHFLIFTDWDPREHGFLKTECEGAYRLVAREFNRPVKENVFEGKLPIYMFADPATFRRFAAEVDEEQLPATVLGYFQPVDLMGHMAMWKPGIGTGIGEGGSLDEAKRRWGRTLAHEFCHAFLHRYKSNAPIPRWLNEGLAELIAERALPTNNYYAGARVAAQSNADVLPLFEDSTIPNGAAYPVMMTMVEMLVGRDRQGLIKAIDLMKDGTSADDAISQIFHLDRRQLAAAWTTYARALQ